MKTFSTLTHRRKAHTNASQKNVFDVNATLQRITKKIKRIQRKRIEGRHTPMHHQKYVFNVNAPFLCQENTLQRSTKKLIHTSTHHQKN
jgi:hypothetical protein